MAGTVRTTAVVPAYNEAKNLPHILPGIRRQVDEVVLVDGGSRDGTCEVAAGLVDDIIIVRQAGRGKGGAIGAGVVAAGGDVLIMLDADGSMDPSEIPRYISAAGAADVVKGSRKAAGGGSDDLTVLRRTGNAGLRTAANLLLGTCWTELAYGYFALTREAAEMLRLSELDRPSAPAGRLQYGQGFEIETLIFTRAVRLGLTVVEIPSFEHRRIHGRSNLNTFRDGTRVLGALLKEATQPGPGRRILPGRPAHENVPGMTVRPEGLPDLPRDGPDSSMAD